jgi:hypothetical protein
VRPPPLTLAAELQRLPGEAIGDGRQREEIDELGIELRTAPLPHDVERATDAAAAMIAAAVRDGVEGVGDGDDARREGDALAAQSTWIAAAVPPLMVREHAGGELRVEGVERLEHLGSAGRMRGDGAALARGEASILVHDVEQGLVYLADVMKQRNTFDGPTLPLVETGGLGDDQGIRRHAADMHAGLRVVRFDRIEECLERRGGESFDCAARAVFASHEDGAGEHTERERES